MNVRIGDIEIAWLRRLLAEWVSEVENDPERWPLDPHCNECTQGLTPKDQDHGLCVYHETKGALADCRANP